jgi:hypothetical protein
LAASAQGGIPTVEIFLKEKILLPMVEEHRSSRLASLPERESFLKRGFAFQEAELAAARARLSEKAQAGDGRARLELGRIRERQRNLASQRDTAVRALIIEPAQIMPGTIRFIAHALIIPTLDPEDARRHDAAIEAIAMRVAIAYEEAAGALVKDVSTADLARAAGLGDHPGFDLLSYRTDGLIHSIEVKGRAGTGNVDISDNEWAKACNLREQYWLYTVFGCNSPHPQLIRVRDPWGKLIASVRGYSVGADEIMRAAEE